MIRSMRVPLSVVVAAVLLSGCTSEGSSSNPTHPGSETRVAAPTSAVPSTPAGGGSVPSDNSGQKTDCSISIAEDYKGPIPRAGCNPLNMAPVQLEALTAQRYETVKDLASAAQSAGWSCGSDPLMGMGRGKMECEPQFGTINYEFFVMEDPSYPSEFANKVEARLSAPAPKGKSLYVVIGPNWIIYGQFGANFIPTITSQLRLGGEVRKIPNDPYSSRTAPPAA